MLAQNFRPLPRGANPRLRHWIDLFEANDSDYTIPDLMTVALPRRTTSRTS